MWSYKGDGEDSWCVYSDSDNAGIEKAFQKSSKTYKLNAVYKIDFNKMIQFRTDDPGRWRAIKRSSDTDIDGDGKDDDHEENASVATKTSKKTEKKVSKGAVKGSETVKETGKAKKKENSKTAATTTTVPSSAVANAHDTTAAIGDGDTSVGSSSSSSSSVASHVGVGVDSSRLLLLEKANSDLKSELLLLRKSSNDNNNKLTVTINENNVYKNENEVLKKENDNLNSKINQLQKEKAEIQQKNKETNEHLSTQINKHTNNIQQLTQQIAQQHIQIQKLTNQNKTLTTTLQSIQSHISSALANTPSSSTLENGSSSINGSSHVYHGKRSASSVLDSKQNDSDHTDGIHHNDTKKKMKYIEEAETDEETETDANPPEPTQALIDTPPPIHDLDATLPVGLDLSNSAPVAAIRGASHSSSFTGGTTAVAAGPATFTGSVVRTYMFDGRIPLSAYVIDSDRMLVGHKSGKIGMIDISTGNIMLSLQGTIKDSEMDDDIHMADNEDDAINVTRGNSGDTFAITYWPPNKIVAGQGRYTRVYDINKKKCILQFDEGQGCYVTVLTWIDNGFLAVGISGKYNGCKLYDVKNAWSVEKHFPTKSEEVRAIVQINDKIAIGGCSSSVDSDSSEEHGSIEIWPINSDNEMDRTYLHHDVTVPAMIGLRCNALILHQNTLIAAYEYCSTGQRMLLQYILDEQGIDTKVITIEPKNTPDNTENTFTGLTTMANGDIASICYGGKILIYHNYKKCGTYSIHDETVYEESSHILTTADGTAIISMGGNGQIKLSK